MDITKTITSILMNVLVALLKLDKKLLRKTEQKKWQHFSLLQYFLMQTLNLEPVREQFMEPQYITPEN